MNILCWEQRIETIVELNTKMSLGSTEYRMRSHVNCVYCAQCSGLTARMLFYLADRCFLFSPRSVSPTLTRTITAPVPDNTSRYRFIQNSITMTTRSPLAAAFAQASSSPISLKEAPSQQAIQSLSSFTGTSRSNLVLEVPPEQLSASGTDDQYARLARRLYNRLMSRNLDMTIEI